MKRFTAILLTLILAITTLWLSPVHAEPAQAASPTYKPGFKSFSLNSQGTVQAKWDGGKKILSISGSGQIEVEKWKELARKFDKNSYRVVKKSAGKPVIVSWGSSYFHMQVGPGVGLPERARIDVQAYGRSGQSGFFHGFDGTISLAKDIDLSQIQDIGLLFARSGIKELDMTGWDTSALKNAYSMMGSRGSDKSTKLRRFEISHIPGWDNLDPNLVAKLKDQFQWPEFESDYVVDTIGEDGQVLSTEGPFRGDHVYEYEDGRHCVARTVYNSKAWAAISKLRYVSGDMVVNWTVGNDDSKYSGFEIYRGSRPENMQLVKTIRDKDLRFWIDDSAKRCSIYFYAIRPIGGRGDLKGKLSKARAIFTVEMDKAKAYSKYKKVRLSLPENPLIKYASSVEVHRASFPDKKYCQIDDLKYPGRKQIYPDQTTYDGNLYYYRLKPYIMVSGQKIYGMGSSVSYKNYQGPSHTIRKWPRGVTVKWNRTDKADGYTLYKWSYPRRKFVRVRDFGPRANAYYDSKVSKNCPGYYRIHCFRRINGRTLTSKQTITADKPKIVKYISRYNQESRKGKGVSYIVIHYVGAISSAKANCKYFASGNVGASAHFFVDNKIWQCIPEEKAAWHCGGGLQDFGRRLVGGNRGARYHGLCTNRNSIGIELCCYRHNGRVLPSPEAINTAVPLVRYLMDKHKVPAYRVIRHFDVTGKVCPNGYTDRKNWAWLHETLTGVSGQSYASVK